MAQKLIDKLQTPKAIKWFWILLASPVALILLLLLLIGIGVCGKLPTFEELENPKSNLATEIYSEDGKMIGSFFVQNRSYCDYDELSPSLVAALVSTEDMRFYSHSGIDFISLARVAVRTIALAQFGQGGGSTISQQTAKNVFCLPARTWLRKGVEAWFTVLIETFWSKRRIMEVYLNVIETGRNMYGVEAPARGVYGKTAAELNAYEASMIATVLPNPLRRDMAAPSGYMVRRAAQVRSLMGKLGPIEFDRPEGGKDKD